MRVRLAGFTRLLITSFGLATACGSSSSSSGQPPDAGGSFDGGDPGGGDAASDASGGGDAGDAASPGLDGGEAGAHHDGFGGSVPASTTATYRIAAGSSVVMSQAATGFYITATPRSYRLTWQGSGEVWGSVWTAGHITSVGAGCVDTSCGIGPDDFISPKRAVMGGEQVDFDAAAAAKLDGFEFAVDAEPVYFGLLIGGVPSPDRTFFTAAATGQTSTAGAMPFGLTTQ